MGWVAVPETLTTSPPRADPTAGEEDAHPARNEKWMDESPGVVGSARKRVVTSAPKAQGGERQVACVVLSTWFGWRD